MKILWGLIACLFLGTQNVAAFPERLSVEAAPALSINRIYSYREPACRNKGYAMRVAFGAAYHFSLQECSDLSTGLTYSAGHMGLQRCATTFHPAADELYLVHYLLAPILIRLYTNEIYLDNRLYFKAGPMPSLYLIRRPIAPLHAGEVALVRMRRLGCFFLLGGGWQYDFSFNNSFTLGLSYCCDVFGVMHKKEDALSGSVFGHNDFVCVDLGFVFHGTERNAVPAAHAKKTIFRHPEGVSTCNPPHPS